MVFFFLRLRDSGKTAFLNFLKKMLVALQRVLSGCLGGCCVGVYSVCGNKENSDHHYYLIFIYFIMAFIWNIAKADI